MRDPVYEDEVPYDSAHGPVTVNLTPDDVALADRIAEARDGNGKARGWKPILNIDSARGHRLGARGELAVVRAYDAPWIDPERLDHRRQHDPDVGEVDVRAVSSPQGGMPIRSRDRDDRAHVLVTVADSTCVIVGWCFGYDAKRPEFWREADSRGPGYWSVPQSVLFDPVWLPIEPRHA